MVSYIRVMIYALFVLLSLICNCVHAKASSRNACLPAKLSSLSSSSLLNIRGGNVIDAATTTIIHNENIIIRSISKIPLSGVKILLQITLTLINMASWAVPLRNKNISQNLKILSLANSFAGGIFLILTFGHLLPHATSVLDSIGVDRSYAFNFTLLGYVFIFFIEKIAFNSHAILHQVMDDSNANGHHHSHSHEHRHVRDNSYISIGDVNSSIGSGSISDDSSTDSSSGSSSGGNGVDVDGQASCNLDHDHTGHNHSNLPSSDNLAAPSLTSDMPAIVADNYAVASAAVSDAKVQKAALSPNAAIILLVAMSVHSLFETMALGIATDKASAIMMAASIGLHQPAESIALLVAFLKTSMPPTAIIRWLAMFSMIGPIGVTLGVFLSNLATPFLDAVIVSITAGTFLYIGATEVVNEEFDDVQGYDKYSRFAAFLGGIGVILGVSRATQGWEGGHSHSHGHHSH